MSYTDLEEKIIAYFEKRAKDLNESITINVKFDLQNAICTVQLKKMYQGIGQFTSFKDLSYLSELLGTEEINLENEDYYGGCDSCDWGSSDKVDIVCNNIKVD